MEGIVQELWSPAKINVNLRKKIVTNLNAIGRNGFKVNVLKHVVLASLLENVNVQKSINVSDRLLNQSNVAQNAKVKSKIPGANGQIGQIVQNHVQPMEKEVIQLEHENVMEHVTKEHREWSGLVIRKNRVRSKVEMDSGQVGVTGVLALVRVKKLLRIDGEIANLVGINAMDKIKKLFLVKCITVMEITQITKIIIGKISLGHGQIGQIGRIVLKRADPDLFIDPELAIENRKDAKISLAER